MDEDGEYGYEFDVFKNLLQNLTSRARTIDLIDELVREGGSPFWGLKKLMEEVQ